MESWKRGQHQFHPCASTVNGGPFFYLFFRSKHSNVLCPTLFYHYFFCQILTLSSTVSVLFLHRSFFDCVGFGFDSHDRLEHIETMLQDEEESGLPGGGLYSSPSLWQLDISEASSSSWWGELTVESGLSFSGAFTCNITISTYYLPVWRFDLN